ncbi:MAG: dockerin type I repeat-containing protein [Bacteroidales bacterium]|nr:dockerin type I repeat-containing protein [Bacteroidales bacterium]
MKQNLLLLTVVCLMPIWSHAQSLQTSNVDKVSDANISLSESRINHSSSSYLVNEGFENYEVGIFEPVYPWSVDFWHGLTNISENHAYTGEKSLNVKSDDNIFCDMGGLTSGHYVLNMYWYLEQDQWAYTQILKDNFWSCEVYIYSADYAWINIPDKTGDIFQSVHWDNVEYDTWFSLTFDIDLDNDWIVFSVNNEMVAGWQFSLSMWGDPSLKKLSTIEFDGDMKKHGDGSKPQLGDFYIDDVTLIDVNGGDYYPVENLVSQVSADTVTLLWSEPQGQPSSYLVNEGLENYEVGLFEPVYPWFVEYDIYDVNISDNHSHTGEKSLNIEGDIDQIFCDMGGLTSGHYVLNMYWYLEQNQRAYMEIDKEGSEVGSCEVFIFSADYAWINIPDGSGEKFQSVHWDNVEYDTWFPLTFDIDLDNDWITFSVNNEMVTGWQFSLSNWGGNGLIKLDRIEFDDNMKFYYSFYIDDVTLMDVNRNKDVVIGYNVTRDGELVGTTDDTSFTETGLTNGTYNYCVTAVYSEGESEPVCVDAIVDYLLVGDANGDGDVNVADISTIAAHIVGYNPSPFYFENADVNGDGIINVLDITALIYKIFSEKGTC